MCIFKHLIPFSEQCPPEGVDLFVCSNSSDPDERTYGVMQFFKKDSRRPEQFYSTANTKEERFVDNIMHTGTITSPAPESGFYFLDTDEHGMAVWIQSVISPLDALYAVINPEDSDCSCTEDD